MDAKQEAKLKMYRAVQNYCQSNSPIITANPAFVTAFGELGAKIDLINAAVRQSEQILTGITADKNAVKQKLCRMTAETAGVIYAYASTVGDLTLRDQMDLPVTTLARSREDALAPRCQNVHDAGVANLAALANYGITQTSLDTLQTAIDLYSQQTPKPRTAYSERKTANSQIVRLFEDADELLKNRLDRLAQTFKAAHPDFVETYETTRRILKPPTTATQLKGIVTDKITGAPIFGAHITAAPHNKTSPTVTADTDAEGEYQFKPILHGNYRVTIAADGYPTFQTEINLLMGEINELDVELEK